MIKAPCLSKDPKKGYLCNMAKDHPSLLHALVTGNSSGGECQSWFTRQADACQGCGDREAICIGTDPEEREAGEQRMCNVCCGHFSPDYGFICRPIGDVDHRTPDHG